MGDGESARGRLGGRGGQPSFDMQDLKRRLGLTREPRPPTAPPPRVLTDEERGMVIEVCHDLMNRAMQQESWEAADPSQSPQLSYLARVDRAKEAAIRKLLALDE